MLSIGDNVRYVEDDIADAVARSGRSPDAVTLVAVSKTRPASDVDAAIEAGIRTFGENRLQEAESKVPDVRGEAVWHLVGHLQSNKAARAAKLFDWIDSIDSKKIVDRLARTIEGRPKPLNVLIQVNISGEDAKSGVDPARITDLLRYTERHEQLAVRGLMTIGSLGATEDRARAEFVRMRELFETVRSDPSITSDLDTLSMGMSGDFAIAVEEGATMVRVGTAIFGTRNHG
jgi:PLP dependent protein